MCFVCLFLFSQKCPSLNVWMLTPNRGLICWTPSSLLHHCLQKWDTTVDLDWPIPRTERLIQEDTVQCTSICSFLCFFPHICFPLPLDISYLTTFYLRSPSLATNMIFNIQSFLNFQMGEWKSFKFLTPKYATLT